MWRWTPPGIPPQSPLAATQIHAVTDSVIIATTRPYSAPVCGNGTVFALQRSTQRVLWQIEKPWALTHAAIAGDTLYILFNCGDLVALDVATGRTQWARSWAAREPGSAVSTSVVVEVRRQLAAPCLGSERLYA